MQHDEETVTVDLNELLQQHQQREIITETIEDNGDDDEYHHHHEEEQEDDDEYQDSDKVDMVRGAVSKKKKTIDMREKEVEEKEKDSLLFTQSDFVHEVWNEAFPVLHNIRLMVASLTKYATEMKKIDPQMGKVYESEMMRDLLKEIHNLCLSKGMTMNEYCAKDNLKMFMKKSIPIEMVMCYSGKDIMTCDTYNEVIKYHNHYIDGLAGMRRTKKRKMNTVVPEKTKKAMKKSITTSPILTCASTSATSQQQGKKKSLFYGQQQQQQRRGQRLTKVAAAGIEDEESLEDTQDDDDDDVVICSSNEQKSDDDDDDNEEEKVSNKKKKKMKIQSDIMKMKKKQKKISSLFDSSSSSNNSNIEDLLQLFGNVPDRIPQHIAMQNESGTVTTLKSPGEVGEEIVRIQLYDTNKVLGKEQRNWWKYAKLRTQFVMSSAPADKLKNSLVQKLVALVAKDMKRIPGIVKDTRSYSYKDN